MNTTVLHVADSHLGTHRASGTTESRAARSGLNAAVRTALVEDVDAIVHAGNLFASPDPPDPVVAGCRRVLRKVADYDVAVHAIAGPDETGSDGDALEPLVEDGLLERLSTEPTVVGDGVALYGHDHVTPDAFGSLSLSLGAADAHTRLLCLNQAFAPPLSDADASAKPLRFLAGSVDGYVDALLLGGHERYRAWEGRRAQAYYAGTTDPSRTLGRNLDPTANRVTVGRGVSGERVPLDVGLEDALETPTIEVEGAELVEPRRDVYDGALLALERLLVHDVDRPEELANDALADLVIALSKIQYGARDLRRELRDLLKERVDHVEPIEGRLGAVRREGRRRFDAKPEDVLADRLSEAGVDLDRVLSPDERELKAVADDDEVPLDREDLFHVDHTVYLSTVETHVDPASYDPEVVWGLLDAIAGRGTTGSAAEDGTEAAAAAEDGTDRARGTIRYVACPVEDCSMVDRVDQVAAHVTRSDDPDHQWGELPYSGVNDFKRRRNSF